MISEHVIALITCALSDDKHTVEKPLALSCSHHVCKNCVEKVKTETIKCKICNLVNKTDLKDIKESICAKLLIEQNVASLFEDVKAKIESTVKSFQSFHPFYSELFPRILNQSNFKLKKDVHIELSNRLDVQVEFIKEEIYVKIESIKHELDILGSTLIDSLNQVKRYFQKFVWFIYS